jgi:hypothetical protein
MKVFTIYLIIYLCLNVETVNPKTFGIEFPGWRIGLLQSFYLHRRMKHKKSRACFYAISALFKKSGCVLASGRGDTVVLSLRLPNTVVSNIFVLEDAE